MGLFGKIGKIAKGVGGFATKLPSLGAVAGGVLDAAQGLSESKAKVKSSKLQDQLALDTLGLNRDRFAEDTRQFDQNFGESQRQFDQRFGLDRDRFSKEKETEDFGRARNARFAKVRAPLVGGLLAGRTIADDPQATARLAKLG